MTTRSVKVKGEKLSFKSYGDVEKLITGSLTGDTPTGWNLKVKGTYLYWVDNDGKERRKQGILTGVTGGTPSRIKVKGNRLYYNDYAGDERYIGLTATEVIRPDGTGDLTEFATQYPASGEHWDKVDEVSHDDDATYIADSSDTPDKDDLYTLADLSAGVEESITQISVNAYVTSSIRSLLFRTAGLLIKTGGTVYQDLLFYHDYPVGLYKRENWLYTTNPQTGNAWTIAEVNALQAGIHIRGVHVSPYATWRFTQLYVTVTYIPL